MDDETRIAQHLCGMKPSVMDFETGEIVHQGLEPHEMVKVIHAYRARRWAELAAKATSVCFVLAIAFGALAASTKNDGLVVLALSFGFVGAAFGGLAAVNLSTWYSNELSTGVIITPTDLERGSRKEWKSQKKDLEKMSKELKS